MSDLSNEKRKALTKRVQEVERRGGLRRKSKYDISLSISRERGWKGRFKKGGRNVSAPKD